MLRRKPYQSRLRVTEMDRDRGNADNFPLTEDELSPRELMALLTHKTERRIDEAFAKKGRIQKERA